MRPEIIIVRVRPVSDGAFIAGSADLRGLHVLAKDRSALDDEVTEAIEALYAAKGVTVQAQKVPSPSQDALVWVAVPSVFDLNECA